MAINQENKININVEAEKMAFSDKIAVSTPYRDMAKPSEEIKVSPLAFDFSKPNSFNPFEFEKGGVNLQKENPITLESQPLKFDQSINFNLSNESSLMAGMGENKNLESVSNLLSSQKLLNTTLLQKTGMDSVDINKQVNKIIGNTVTPALENMSQYVQQMSNLNTDHKNLHDELPTISPTNLAFVDRSAAAMDKPGWA